MTELANLPELNKALTKILKNVEDRSKLLRHVGLYSIKYIKQTIRMGGRPSRPWEPLSPMTIAFRRNKDKSKIKPLIDKGVLLNSIHILGIHKTAVDVGTAVDYAPKLHFGGMTKRQEFNLHVRRHKRKGHAVRAHNRHVVLNPKRIPARPYMFIGDDGEKQIKVITSNYIKEAMNP